MTSSNETNSNNIEMEAAYRRAMILDQESKPGGRKTSTFNTTLFPHWIGDTDSFWYERESRSGKIFRVVDAKAKTNNAAFDHDKLSNALSEASGETLTADNLPISTLDLNDAPEKMTFSAFGKRWVYHSASDTCETLYELEEIKISPDGKHALFSRDYNLWVRELDSGNERPLTEDGERFYVYASTAAVWGYQSGTTLEALWSPDSKRIFTQVIDTRKVGVGVPLVEHVPADGSLRPRIINPDRRVAFPGDEHIDVFRFLGIELQTGNIEFAKTADNPVTFMQYIGHFTGYRGWWDQDSRHAYFVEEERGMKAHRLQRFDTCTGTVQTLLEETSDFHAMLIPSTHVCPLYMALPETNEVIWYSERSGTAHFYLYDTTTGELKNSITQGNWIVRNGLRVDAERRELTF